LANNLGSNILTKDEIVLGLPGYQITTMDIEDGQVRSVPAMRGPEPVPIAVSLAYAARGFINAGSATRIWAYAIRFC